MPFDLPLEAFQIWIFPKKAFSICKQSFSTESIFELFLIFNTKKNIAIILGIAIVYSTNHQSLGRFLDMMDTNGQAQVTLHVS